MHKDVLIAAIGNPLAWLFGGWNWGIAASVATTIYFGIKGMRELWDWYHESKKKRRPWDE